MFDNKILDTLQEAINVARNNAEFDNDTEFLERLDQADTFIAKLPVRKSGNK